MLILSFFVYFSVLLVDYRYVMVCFVLFYDRCFELICFALSIIGVDGVTYIILVVFLFLGVFY